MARSELSKRRARLEKHTPPEIREIRRRRERRRVAIGSVLWLTWLGLLISSLVAGDNTAGTVLSQIAAAFCLAQLAVATAAYEWALRKVTGRQQADYRKIHKMEKTLEKTLRKEEALSAGSSA